MKQKTNINVSIDWAQIVNKEIELVKSSKKELKDILVSAVVKELIQSK
jgi:hypothetical protein